MAPGCSLRPPWQQPPRGSLQLSAHTQACEQALVGFVLQLTGQPLVSPPPSGLLKFNVGHFRIFFLVTIT